MSGHCPKCGSKSLQSFEETIVTNDKRTGRQYGVTLLVYRCNGCMKWRGLWKQTV